MINRRFIFLTMGLCLLGSFPAEAQQSSRIGIMIVLEKTDYTLGETLAGEIEVRNNYPSIVPSIFEMRLSHNGIPVKTSQVSVQQLYQGKTTLSLRSFQIPQGPFTTGDFGTWTIHINKIHQSDQYAAVVSFNVNPSTLENTNALETINH